MTKRLGLSVFAAFVVVSSFARESVIRDVKIDRPSIFAGLDRVTLSARLLRDGRVSVAVIDRDGYRVRTLAADAPVKSGPAAWQWDGRDDGGSPVPDEAYSWRIDWRNGPAHETWFPANQSPPKMQAIPVRYYDHRGGTPFTDPKSRQMDGPVMKTVVNREPRSKGAVADHWNGFDESGQIYVPGLRDFVTAI